MLLQFSTVTLTDVQLGTAPQLLEICSEPRTDVFTESYSAQKFEPKLSQNVDYINQMIYHCKDQLSSSQLDATYI